MKSKRKSEGISVISSDQQVVDLETHCRKVHSEAVVESIILAFSAPIKAADKLFSKSKESLEGDQATHL